MARKRALEEDAGLTMTPLVDIVLLLLIFYIVTTAFVDRELELKLPEADASSVPEEKKKFTIEVSKDGGLALNGELVTLERLDRTLETEQNNDNIQSVEIRADKLVSHGRFVEVLGVVKKHGIEAVGIAVKQRQSGV